MRFRSSRATALTDGQTAVVWQAASLLIGYPDDELMARLPLLRRAVAGLPEQVAAPLTTFLDHASATPPGVLAAEYVATFDHRKRHCLHLTYYAHGDTRRRGMALLRLKETYRAAGLVLVDDELPDHLSVLLEFGAGRGWAEGVALLTAHRAGLELLRLTLAESGSPWTPVLDAVSATLPPLDGVGRDAVLRLAASGPPEEEVGLAPFGGPVLLSNPRPRPGLQPHGART